MEDFDYRDFWKEALSRTEAELGEGEFGTWFAGICYLQSAKNCIVIGFPSGFHRDRFIKRYQSAISEKLKSLSGTDIKLEYIVVQENEVIPDKETKQAAGETENINAAAKEKEKKAKKKHSQLIDDYTFEKYVIGENNKFAANAAIAISRNPGKAYNPFLISGLVGMGKTHLMQAIGNYIYDNSENKVICITSEDFLNEYMDHVAGGKMSSFKNKFRNTDVLLIDDIQFFQDKPRCQEELFHTFNALRNANKQLVFTCDRAPLELKNFDERLISRFTQGVWVDIQPPRYEEKCAILKKTAENRNASISNEVIDLISKNISTNIRDLIGALNTLISYTEIMGQEVTLEIAQQKLRDVLSSQRQANLTIDTIQKAVADFFSLNSGDLRGKKRSQKVSYPRQLAMYLCREMTDYSTTEIGEAFGGRDHATVIYSIDKIQGLKVTDPALDSTLDNLKRRIKELGIR